MDTAKFCIRHRVATLLAVILITVFGIMFSTQLQMALMPDIEAPMAIVMCYYNGASPSDMEELVTRPLESAILSVSGVDSVSSTSSDGVSQLQVTYVDGTNLDIAATKLREQFNRTSLPDGATDPVIVNLNISELMPTAIIALKGDDLAQLQSLAEDTVAPALERIDGVARSPSPAASPSRWRCGWTPPCRGTGSEQQLCGAVPGGPEPDLSRRHRGKRLQDPYRQHRRQVPERG